MAIIENIILTYQGCTSLWQLSGLSRENLNLILCVVRKADCTVAAEAASWEGEAGGGGGGALSWGQHGIQMWVILVERSVRIVQSVHHLEMNEKQMVWCVGLSEWLSRWDWQKGLRIVIVSKGPRGKSDCIFMEYNRVKVSDLLFRGVGQTEWFKE